MPMWVEPTFRLMIGLLEGVKSLGCSSPDSLCSLFIFGVSAKALTCLSFVSPLFYILDELIYAA